MRGDLMADAAGSGPGPLRGLRVLDCTHSWAGPVATQFVAFFGAEVIHVEPPRRPDRWRGPVTPGPDTPLAYRYPGGEPGKRPFDRNGLFNEKNTNKLGLSLDIAHPRGRESAELRWVPITDVDRLPLHPGFAATWPEVRPS